MLNLADFIQYGVFGIGLFVILGGMLFRKTYAVARNIALAPVMGIFPLLVAASADSASSLLARLAGLADLALRSGGTVGLSGADLGLRSALFDRLFPFSAVLSAVFLGIAVSFPLRSAFLLRIHSMVVTAFAATGGVLTALALLGVEFGWPVLLAVFLSSAVLLGCLEKFDFNIALILETSAIGSLLILSPFRTRFDLNIFVHLLFAVLLLAVFLILDLMVLKRRNASKT